MSESRYPVSEVEWNEGDIVEIQRTVADNIGTRRIVRILNQIGNRVEFEVLSEKGDKWWRKGEIIYIYWRWKIIRKLAEEEAIAYAM